MSKVPEFKLAEIGCGNCCAGNCPRHDRSDFPCIWRGTKTHCETHSTTIGCGDCCAGSCPKHYRRDQPCVYRGTKIYCETHSNTDCQDLDKRPVEPEAKKPIKLEPQEYRQLRCGNCTADLTVWVPANQVSPSAEPTPSYINTPTIHFTNCTWTDCDQKK